MFVVRSIEIKLVKENFHFVFSLLSRKKVSGKKMINCFIIL